MSENPFDRRILNSFIEARAAYKRTCRNAEKCFRLNLAKQLSEVGQRDPKLFWNIINKMNNWGKEKVDLSDNISPKRWKLYFEELLNENRDPITPKTRTNQINTFDISLDEAITARELRDALKNLKNGKIPGPDGIHGEYLKMFGEKFE